MQQLIGIFIGFLVVGGAMMLLERRWPSVRDQPVLRRGWLLDLAYWLFTPIVTRAISRAAVIMVAVVVTMAIGRSLDRDAILAGFGPIGAQPRWLQAIEMIVLLDLISYWLHRAFHGRRLWPFHAIHHSSEDLDWLSSVRVHPVNDLINRAVPAAIVLLLGFKPDVLVVALPFFALFAILLHANVDWDFGPLRAVIASPRFHRWHHTAEDDGRDRNFAGLLPLWDILFGTYYMPARAATSFGIRDKVPATLWGQLAWPFRRPRPRERST